MTALASRTNATLPRLSRVISRLEDAGLVERTPCPEDRRATNAVLDRRRMGTARGGGAGPRRGGPRPGRRRADRRLSSISCRLSPLDCSASSTPRAGCSPPETDASATPGRERTGPGRPPGRRRWPRGRRCRWPRRPLPRVDRLAQNCWASRLLAAATGSSATMPVGVQRQGQQRAVPAGADIERTGPAAGHGQRHPSAPRSTASPPRRRSAGPRPGCLRTAEGHRQVFGRLGRSGCPRRRCPRAGTGHLGQVTGRSA